MVTELHAIDSIRLAAKFIYIHMTEELPIEACGIVWSDGTTTRLINQARSPTRFAVGQTSLAEAFAAADPDEKTLVAYYHSHPGGVLSLSDEDRSVMKLQYASGISIPWVVMVPDRAWRAWYWDQQYDRPFLLGGAQWLN